MQFAAFDLVSGVLEDLRGPLARWSAAAELLALGRPVGPVATGSDAKDWAGHEVLDLPSWSVAKNDQWVQSVMDRNMPVYVASNPTEANLWDAVAGRETVFGRELGQFIDAGYSWDGWTLVPPGGG